MLEYREERTGKRHEDLDGAPVPARSAYLIEMFWDVGPCSSGAAGPIPVTYAEIAAWVQLTGRPVAPWEVRILRLLSSLYCKVVGEHSHLDKDDAP